jgi:Domain of unknown function (DUF1906)
MRLSAWILGALAGCHPVFAQAAGPACEAGKGYVAVDLSEPVNASFLQGIKGVGIGTVIRYYDWDPPTLVDKTLTKSELQLIARAGLSVAVVFQHHNDSLTTFTDDVYYNRPQAKRRGTKDANRSLALARDLGQPRGSAIYFGIDGVDDQFRSMLSKTTAGASDQQLLNFTKVYVRRYFVDVSAIVKPSGYKIGAYGSGLTCSYLLDERVIDYCWLAAATSWPGFETFERSKRWVLRQYPPTRRSNCFGREVDLNVGNGTVQDFGQWRPVHD